MRVKNFARLYVGESMLDTMGLRGTSGLCILGRRMEREKNQDRVDGEREESRRVCTSERERPSTWTRDSP